MIDVLLLLCNIGFCSICIILSHKKLNNTIQEKFSRQNQRLAGQKRREEEILSGIRKIRKNFL